VCSTSNSSVVVLELMIVACMGGWSGEDDGTGCSFRRGLRASGT
jgi:hypothetical protein